MKTVALYCAYRVLTSTRKRNSMISARWPSSEVLQSLPSTPTESPEPKLVDLVWMTCFGMRAAADPGSAGMGLGSDRPIRPALPRGARRTQSSQHRVRQLPRESRYRRSARTGRRHHHRGHPITVASDVIRIGRRRTRHEATMASRASIPSLRGQAAERAQD
jgi:hypothetical protein